MKRYDRTLGLLFIDIDHFKRINDNFGHRAGDKVLKMVATVLLKNIRSFDTVGRWGGEEFIVIVLNVNKKRLMKIANKLRSEAIVEVKNLCKSYGKIKAVDNISFEVLREKYPCL